MRSLLIWIVAMLLALLYSWIVVTNAWAGFIVGVSFGIVAWYVEDFTEWFK